MTSTVTLRGRRGTCGTGLALVARLGLRLAPLSPRLLAWQAWHLVTSTVTSRGRRGTYGTELALVARLGLRFGAVVAAAVGVASVALGDISRHFAWQAWHLVTSTVTLRGRCGTYGTGSGGARLRWASLSPRPVGVAGVALGDIECHLAWQAWHLVTSTVTLRGRRGTWRHGPPLCVAGLALGDMDLHFAWQAWHL